MKTDYVCNIKTKEVVKISCDESEYLIKLYEITQGDIGTMEIIGKTVKLSDWQYTIKDVYERCIDARNPHTTEFLVDIVDINKNGERKKYQELRNFIVPAKSSTKDTTKQQQAQSTIVKFEPQVYKEGNASRSKQVVVAETTRPIIRYKTIIYNV